VLTSHCLKVNVPKEREEILVAYFIKTVQGG
jgi:hypothetical protein